MKLQAICTVFVESKVLQNKQFWMLLWNLSQWIDSKQTYKFRHENAMISAINEMDVGHPVGASVF